jgi:hypothetical protein
MTTPADREGDQRDRRREQVATTLIGATAAVAALFTLLGATSDRAWVILDDSTAKKLMFATAFLAASAIGLALWALLTPDARAGNWRLIGGSVAFVAALAFAVWTASAGANQFARPSFTQLSIGAPSAEERTLRFTVSVESLDPTQRIGVVVQTEGGRVLYAATLLPGSSGTASQEVSLGLSPEVGSLHLAAWHRDRSSAGAGEPMCDARTLPDGTACITIDL